MRTERVFPQKAMPDRIELRIDDDTKQQQLVFFYVRNNSRNLDVFKTDLAHALQDAGLCVRVLAVGNEITLEQFERTGVYGFKQSATVQSKQGLYNKRSELRLLETSLQDMSQDDPRYYLISQRVQHLRAMLSTVEPLASDEAVKASDDRLKRLEQILKEEIDERKPDVASQVNATDKDGQGSVTTTVGVDRREGD